MNPRIKDLAGKALDQTVPETWTVLSYEQLEKFQQTFAKLIIEDCCTEILKWKQEPFPFDESTAVWIIKKNFGVDQ